MRISRLIKDRFADRILARGKRPPQPGSRYATAESLRQRGFTAPNLIYSLRLTQAAARTPKA